MKHNFIQERNTSVGAGSMKVITTGNDNTAVGYWSQYGASITGDFNTSVGSNSLKNLIQMEIKIFQ